MKTEIEMPWDHGMGEEDVPDFVLLPVRRGIEAIQPVLNTLANIDGWAFICGGYVRYCASLNEGKRLSKAADVDIYCYNEATFEELWQHFKDAGLKVRHENDMAITYTKPKDKNNMYYGCPVLQLIKPVSEGAIVAVGDVETILKNFDFTVIRCALVYDGDKLVVLADVDFAEDEAKKLLRIKNIHCPISALLRFMKYGRKGYTTRPAQVAKLFADWDGRDMSYRSRLLELFREGGEAGELSQKEIDELEALLRID